MEKTSKLKFVVSINLKNDTPSVLVEGLHSKFHGQFDHFSSWSYNFLFSLSEQSYNFQKLYVHYYRSQVHIFEKIQSVMLKLYMKRLFDSKVKV